MKKMQMVIRAKIDNFEFVASQSGEEGKKIKYTLVRTLPQEIKAENETLLKRLAIYVNK